MSDKSDELLERIAIACERSAREAKKTRELMTSFVNSIMDAESEIPERLRRFGNWFHDIHDVKFIYEEHGNVVPAYLLRELERCDDRMRHILEDMHVDGGALEKIRREMTERGGNRWDHTKQLFKPKETPDETGQRQNGGGLQDGTEGQGGQSGSSG